MSRYRRFREPEAIGMVIYVVNAGLVVGLAACLAVAGCHFVKEALTWLLR